MAAPGDAPPDLEVLLGAMGDGVYALDATGEFIECNDTFAEMAGYDPETLAESGPGLLFEDADIAAFEDAIRVMLDDGGPQTADATLQAADGSEIPVEVSMSLLPADDGFEGTVGVVRDVTERRRRERELERYETLVRAMPDEIYTLDAEGYYTSIVPPKGRELTTTGHRPANLVGRHVSVVLDEDDVERGRELIADLLADPDRETASFEVERISTDGSRVPHENHLALLPSEDGEFRGTVGVLRDITERKAREETLERQNERLAEFADRLSHDLRNPLNVATGTLTLLQDDSDDERLDRIERAHDRMETMIEDILSRARTEQSTDETTVSLATLATDAWSTVDSGDASLVVELPSVAVEGEPDRLRRLFENLYRNAVEHGATSPPSNAREDAVEHGSHAVTVTVGPIEDAGDLIGFFVADDGTGIPPAERDRVLESGYSGTADGTGLGLVIVDRIADAHGWTLAVTASEDGGARFDFAGLEPV